MSNRMLQALGQEYQTLVERYEAIVNRCAEAGRNPDDVEVSGGAVDEAEQEQAASACDKDAYGDATALQGGAKRLQRFVEIGRSKHESSIQDARIEQAICLK